MTPSLSNYSSGCEDRDDWRSLSKEDFLVRTANELQKQDEMERAEEVRDEIDDLKEDESE